MATPYWTGDGITLYHGDCRDLTDWLRADVLVTDPPYGRGLAGIDTTNRTTGRTYTGTNHAAPIVGDEDTSTRDAALTLWGQRPAVVFGDLRIPPPANVKQIAVYKKPSDAGMRSTVGFRRDVEAIYLIGLPASYGGRSSVIETATRMIGGTVGPAGRYGHPHAKPVDVMADLIRACPPGVIADPFAGSGSTLIAARNLGREAIGVELDERYCETIARRLDQGVLDFGEVA